MRALVLQQQWDFYGVYAVYSQLLLLQVSISTVHLSVVEFFWYPIWEFQWIKSTEFCKVNRKTDKTAGRFCFVPITMVTPFVFALQCHLSPLSHCKLKPPKKEIQKSMQFSVSILVLFLLFALLTTAIFLMQFLFWYQNYLGYSTFSTWQEMFS